MGGPYDLFRTVSEPDIHAVNFKGRHAMSLKPKSRKKPAAPGTPAPKPAPIVIPSVFDALPDSAFIREAQLVQS